MKTTKPLWMNEPELEQTSIRFTCPFCYSWIRRAEFEQHIQSQHPQVNIPKPVQGRGIAAPGIKGR
ncbi:MAG: hypothetical protein PHQ60_03115 [Sideroxydans sp.]|nr:hypothetical protein [Sideroxydans sp.]